MLLWNTEVGDKDSSCFSRCQNRECVSIRHCLNFERKSSKSWRVNLFGGFIWKEHLNFENGLSVNIMLAPFIPINSFPNKVVFYKIIIDIIWYICETHGVIFILRGNNGHTKQIISWFIEIYYCYKIYGLTNLFRRKLMTVYSLHVFYIKSFIL